MTQQPMPEENGYAIDAPYTEQTTLDPDLRHFAKIRKVNGQIVDFTTYKELTSNNVLPEDNDHFYWLEYTQVAKNDYNSVSGTPSTITIKAYVDGEPIGLMDDFQVGCVWEPSIKKFLPKVDFGNMSRDLFVFDYTTWQRKVPLYEGGKMQIWNPLTRQYENYTISE